MARRRRGAADARALDALLADGPRDCRRSLRALDGRFIRAGARRRPAAQPRRSCRPGATSTASTRSASPAPSRWPDGARQAERLLDRHLADGAACPRRVAHGAVGHRQPEERGRPDRPGAGADRRAAALRRLRPPRRRRAGAARRARPPAHRRGRDAVGHLPRPAAAADQAAGRGRLPAPPAPTSRSSRTSSASTRSPMPAEHGCDLETAALRVFSQRRGRLRRQRQPADRQRRLGRRGRARRDLSRRRKGFAYGRAGKPARAARRCCRACWPSVDLAYQNLDSVELGVTTVDHYFDTLGGISRAVQPRQGRGGAGLHRRPDARRGHGAHARRAGRARDPHPHAQPEMVRGHARRTATRACARSRRTSPTPWAGRRPPAQVEPWVYQRMTETFVLDAAMRERLAALNPTASRAGREPPDRGARARTTGQPDAATLEALRHGRRRTRRPARRHRRRRRA